MHLAELTRLLEACNCIRGMIDTKHEEDNQEKYTLISIREIILESMTKVFVDKTPIISIARGHLSDGSCEWGNLC